MKFWKSFVVMAMALTLILGGCSSSKSNGEAKDGGKVTVTFWDNHIDAEQKYLKDLVNEYNKSQDKVKVVYKGFNANDYMTTKLPVAFANNEGPDVFMISPGDFTKYANAGIMADLNPYFPDGAKADFQEAAINAVTIDNKVLALPFESELVGLYYNKKMLADAGVEVPKTWDELQAAAKKLTTDKVSGIVLPQEKDAYLNFIWYPFLWQQGGNVISEDGKKSNFNSPEVVKALDFWGSFFQKGYAPAKTPFGSSDIGNLGTGKTAMQVSGTWAISAIESKYSNMDIGLAPLPVSEGGQAKTVAGGWKLAANAHGKHVKEASDFIMWAFAEDPSRPLKWATEVKFAYPARNSVIEAGEEIYNKGLRKVFTDEMYDTLTPEPFYGPEIVDVVGDSLQKVMFSKAKGSDVVKEADQKIQDALDKQ
ncbi:ABC transporter substrate-binding protein [Neobacillus jeddahensis]|uniref:ABC transporter substrate-binding protein n=1 Tax=Neobacillus jeddahensis TaxID=1461580 RepID=UPI0006938FA8|nr:sugar ABC transporter substrate-binding protein [Neobacillus jeddahensis]